MNILSYKKTLLSYLLLCIISFTLSFTLLTPIKIIQNILLPSAQINHFKFSQLTGNIWQGSLIASYQKELNTKVQWNINLSYLLTEKSVLKIILSTAQSQLQLLSNFQGLSPEFKLQGKLNSKEISSQLNLPKRAKMTGLVHIHKLNLKNAPPYYFDNLNIHWDGGYVSADNNRNQLPALNINSTKKNNELITHITEAKSKQILLKIIATADKQAEIQITQRLLTLNKQGKLSDDDNEFVIRFTEKLTF
ncbi:MAG: hypothetical protein GQ581_06790 [Methyloprofundus sp.]|nr:hypothetical protein [Methyloprofundus sp.]